VPVFGPTARAGYVAAEVVVDTTGGWEQEEGLRFAVSMDGGARLVAGLPQGLDDESRDSVEGEQDALPFSHHVGIQVRTGSSRNVPAAPGPRKGASTLDVVFFADPVAQQSVANRLSDYSDTVHVYDPCVRRLFRPPRSI
jgi:hypothetical protein